MTISTVSLTKSYSGNGVTTDFSFPYRFLADGDLVVTLINDTTGVETLQTLTTDYTVTGAGDDAGGTVAMITAPATGETLFIRRTVALTQDVDYITGESFPAETHERALDRLTMIAQQITEATERSIRLADTDTSGASVELPSPVADRVIGWNSTGDALINYSEGVILYNTDPVFNSVQLSGGTGDQGTITWNAEEETYDLVQNGSTLQMGQETQRHCLNNSGATIPNGSAVMRTGTVGGSGKITIGLYDASVPANARLFLGIATYDIPNNTSGKITHFGKVRGIDTSAFTDNDTLYPDPATPGGLTATEPTIGVNQPIAIVVNASVNGTIDLEVEKFDHNAHANLYEDNRFQAVNRGDVTTDNTLSFDLSATNNHTGTPTAAATLTYTNIAGTDGQSGHDIIVNTADYAISAHANTKISATDLVRISTTGTYLLSYRSNGTNVLVVASEDLT